MASTFVNVDAFVELEPDLGIIKAVVQGAGIELAADGTPVTKEPRMSELVGDVYNLKKAFDGVQVDLDVMVCLLLTIQFDS